MFDGWPVMASRVRCSACVFQIKARTFELFTISKRFLLIFDVDSCTLMVPAALCVPPPQPKWKENIQTYINVSTDRSIEFLCTFSCLYSRWSCFSIRHTHRRHTFVGRDAEMSTGPILITLRLSAVPNCVTIFVVVKRTWRPLNDSLSQFVTST